MAWGKRWSKPTVKAPTGAKNRRRGNTRAKYTEALGRVFDSGAEARRAAQLDNLRASGAITGLEFQKQMILGFLPTVKWKVDFFYYDEFGRPTWEDVKGRIDREARIKLSWARSLGMWVKFVKESPHNSGNFHEISGVAAKYDGKRAGLW